MYDAMSVLSITLTLLASLLIAGCAATGEHRHRLETLTGSTPPPLIA